MRPESLQFLRDLLAAFECRRLYGAAHDGSARALARAVASLAQLQALQPAITIAQARGGLLINDVLADEPWATGSAFNAALISSGSHAARLLPGAGQTELVWLIDALQSPGQSECPGGRALLADVISAETGDRAGGGGSVPALTALRAAWGGEQGALGGLAVAAPVATQIAAGLLTSPTSMLQLAQLKDHNEYTFVHTTNVGILASALAESIGVGREQLHQITQAALLHDVGKWRLPNGLLDKKGRLNDDERKLLEQHPAAGAAMLAATPGIPDIAVVVAFEHHHRIDGTGYPKQPRGSFPSVFSQIVQVADIYDALRSQRPYRDPMTPEQCLNVLEQQAGRSFDADLLKHFRVHVLGRVPAARPEPDPGAAPRAAA